MKLLFSFALCLVGGAICALIVAAIIYLKLLIELGKYLKNKCLSLSSDRV